jgi:chromosome segregation protein
VWRLSRLDIRGFKSFADQSELVFPEGITAVVGPNGCGKSNISDAIVWALGEQSTTVLRAQRMKDVIFQGSASRKATGIAEVTLHLTSSREETEESSADAEALFPLGGNIEEEELTITRRLYRSGESEYLLNGEKCLLREIKEKLMGTGLGTRACFTIEQGRIDQILSASPLERRTPIEEAAGISLYRRRRHATNLKLEATAQDLSRVEDIVAEVARQMRSLKRQAGRAERYRTLRGQLHLLEQRWFAISLHRAETDTEVAAAALEAARLGEQTAHEALERSTAAWEHGRRVWRERRQQEAAGRQRLYNAQVELERARSESARQRDRAQFAEGRLDELDRKIAGLCGIEEVAEDAQARRRAAEEAIGAARAELDAAREAEDKARAALEAANVALTEARREWRERRAVENRRRQTLYEAQMQRERARSEAARHTDRAASADDRVRELEHALAERKAAREHRAQVVEDQRAAALQAEEAVRLAERQLQEAQERLDPLMHLKEAAEKAAQDTDSTVELRPLAARIQVEESLGGAVALVLGQRLRVPMLDDDEQEGAWMDAVAERRGLSRGLRAPRSGIAPEAAPDPAVLSALGDAVEGRDAIASAIAADLLRNTWVVADREEALRLGREHPGHGFVDTAGSLWVRGAEIVARNDASAAQLIADSSRDSLKLQVDRGDRGEAGGSSLPSVEIAAARLDVERAEAGVRAARSHATAVAREAASGDNALRQIDGELERIGREIEAQQKAGETARETSARLEEQAEDLDGRCRELQAKIDAGTQGDTVEDREVTALESGVAEARGRVDEAQTHRSRLGAHVAELDRLDREVRGLGRAAEEARASVGASDRAAEQAEQKCRDLEAEIDGQQRVDVEEEAEIAGLEAAVAAARQAQEQAQSRRTTAEVHAAEVRVARQHLHEQVRERLDVEPAQLLREAAVAEDRDPETLSEEEAAVEAMDVPTLQAEIREVRASIDRLGPVNLVAYEDFRQQESRFTDLDGQRRDLVGAASNLREAIRKIDTECVQRFTDAFEAIDGYFNRIFRQLFGGGRAGMRLEDPDDPLNSGIEIMAQPPGKSLQSIRLMSGGERSMIALALMFAIFEYHPAPFCILDEADAALDERNVGRFVQALHRFQERAQFIMITHNKRSMEIADLLYGVTMEESGVSKLVSVALN